MAATSIFFNGKVISIPGSYSEVDASGLETVGFGATGIVALLGTAAGGRAVEAGMEPKDFLRFTQPSRLRQAFRSGDLREAGAILFEPSGDANIPGGAQEVVCMKVNQAVQATRTLSNADGSVLDLTSRDYGEFTNQVSISQQANVGPPTSKQITVTFEDKVEAADLIGADTKFTLNYAPPAGGLGWDRTRAQILSSGIKVNASRLELGKYTDVLSHAMVDGVVTIPAVVAGDNNKTVTIYGLDTSGDPARETLILSDAAAVSGTVLWGQILGATLSAAAAGTINLQDSTPATIIQFVATERDQGLVRASTMFVANSPLILASDAAPTASQDLIQIWGKNAAGVAIAENFTVSEDYAATIASWSEIDVIVLGGFDVARTAVLAGTAIQTVNSVQDTIKKAADFVNARQVSGDGFVMTLVTGNQGYLMSDVDMTSDLAPVVDSAPFFLPVGTNIYDAASFSARGQLKAILDFYNNQTSLVTAERIDFAPKIHDIEVTTVSNSVLYEVILDGITLGYTSDGSATAAEIQAAFVSLINLHPALVQRVSAAAQGAAAIRITARTPAGFANTTVDAKLTTSSVQVTAGAGAPPSDNVSPAFLTGGSEGTATFADYQTALNLLKRIRVNSIVPLTGDPAVHAAVIAHCDYMAGIGRSERDAFVGLSALDIDGVPTNELPTKDEVKSQIVDLNSRHVRAFGQQVTRFNTDGERTDFLPWFQACVAAGMQAGAPVGTSLTFKYGNVLDVAQDSSWNPVDDAEELIQSGFCFMERVDGVGRRFVRNVTTWLKSSNLAFIEGSVNQAVNTAAFEFRTGMEIAVGRRGFAGTLVAAQGAAIGKLGTLLAQNIITGYRALSLELTADVLDVSVELAPIIPINFVKTTLHLVTTPQAA